MAMNIPPRPAPPPPPSVADKPLSQAMEELPVRVIGIALSLPGSSYFSNYEVFLAERRISKNEAQLIKLVYVFLPYQRRLSEFGLDDARVYRLRVKRDATCDESLQQMTQSQTQPRPEPKYASRLLQLTEEERKVKLPCYRTTADEYRKAAGR